MTSSALPQLWIKKGVDIVHDGRACTVVSIVDINKVLVRARDTGEQLLLTIGDIGPPSLISMDKAKELRALDLQAVPEDKWEIAQSRLKHITPLLEHPHARAGAISQKIAQEAGVSRATLYRWVTAYRNTGLLSALLPMQALRGSAASRLDGAVEAIIRDTLQNFYDTDQKPTKTATVQEIRRLCSNAGLRPPATRSVLRRITATESRERTVRRHGAAAAYARHDAQRGSIQDAQWPLAIVQVDHTVLPVIVVDDVHRKSIRRAWITLAIDVYSRMCLGMYISLDAPSAMSAGMCIAHAILVKDAWLRKLDCGHIQWPCWGVMAALHMDNAKEFRGDMVKFAARQYDIDVSLRPVAKPRYGAHIERLMGTVTEGLKTVKGATFSGPDEKGDYDAEGNACMTLRELEQWLIRFFARYHIERHEGIGMMPLEKWRKGLLGDGKTPGRGLPARRLDEESVRINFTPFYERAVKGDGVQIGNVLYYHDVLRPYINMPDPKHPKHTRQFRFHRDPRDVSQLYFYDEMAKRFCAIPYRDSSLPPVSIWELRAAQELAQGRGVAKSSEKQVFALITEQREIETASAEKTKSARRNAQKRQHHSEERKTKAEVMSKVATPVSSASLPPKIRGYDPDDVAPLEDE